MARRYDPDTFITRSGFLIRAVEASRLKRTRQALACAPDSQVLDLGCGSGNLLETLTGARVVGVDLSDFLLGIARRRVAGRPGFSVVKGDAEALEFPDASFDRVACSEVLEHVERPERVLSEIRRVARPGARVALTFPNEGLINATKRAVLALGLKRWIAGGYAMSDDMLDEWHRAEIEADWVIQAAAPGLKHLKTWRVPLPWPFYHTVLAFEAVP